MTNEGMIFEDGCRFLVEKSLREHDANPATSFKLQRNFKCLEFKIKTSEMKKPETFYEEFDTFQEKTILNSNPNVQFKKSGKIESDLNQIYSIEYDFDQWDFEVII